MVLVIGSGKVGSSLARELDAQGHEVVLIENDPKLMANADDIDCLKIIGVPIDKDVLKGAGIEQADALCAVTQDDNMNIMTAQVAREIFRVPKVIARIFNPRSREIFEAFGLDTICSTSLTVDAVHRALSDEEQDQFHTIAGQRLVFSIFKVEGDGDGVSLEDFCDDREKHVLGVRHEGRFLLADPRYRLRQGDEIVIVAKE